LNGWPGSWDKEHTSSSLPRNGFSARLIIMSNLLFGPAFGGQSHCRLTAAGRAFFTLTVWAMP